MAQILKFPTGKIGPLSVRSGPKHDVWVEVVDRHRPKLTRWILQSAVQNAAGFPATKGLKDAVVAMGYRHEFTIGQTWLLHRFLSEAADLVADGLVRIKADGVLVSPRMKRRA